MTPAGDEERNVDRLRLLAERLVATDLQSIYFTRTRNATEVLLKYVRDEARRRHVRRFPYRQLARARQGGGIPEQVGRQLGQLESAELARDAAPFENGEAVAGRGPVSFQQCDAQCRVVEL